MEEGEKEQGTGYYICKTLYILYIAQNSVDGVIQLLEKGIRIYYICIGSTEIEREGERSDCGSRQFGCWYRLIQVTEYSIG